MTDLVHPYSDMESIVTFPSSAPQDPLSPSNEGGNLGPLPGMPGIPVPLKNSKLAVAALVVGILGFVVGCIPGVMIFGWILLPVAFILGVIVVAQPGKKIFGILAIVLSIVGGIVSAMVFIAGVAGVVSDAISEVPTTVEQTESSTEPTTEENGENDKSAQPTATAEVAAGTRENPLPIGTAIEGKEWTVVVNGVNLDGNAAVAEANQFNDLPAEGFKYIIVNLTKTYTGEGSSLANWASVDYLTSTGEVLDTYDSYVTGPEPTFGLDELYAGGSVTGNVVIAIPVDDQGALRVNTGLLEDEVFVSLS